RPHHVDRFAMSPQARHQLAQSHGHAIDLWRKGFGDQGDTHSPVLAGRLRTAIELSAPSLHSGNNRHDQGAAGVTEGVIDVAASVSISAFLTCSNTTSKTSVAPGGMLPLP